MEGAKCIEVAVAANYEVKILGDIHADLAAFFKYHNLHGAGAQNNQYGF